MQINPKSELSVRSQCELLQVSRGNYYYRSVKNDTEKAKQIAGVYQQFPVYGYRRIHAHLKQEGLTINHKCIRRLMSVMKLRAIYPGPKTTVRNRQHKPYPYLLRNLKIERKNQVWQIDLTYLRTEQGFMYLAALIDVHSRYIVGWSLSNTLDTSNCLMALERGIEDHGSPGIINSDQGCQFTGDEWISRLKGLGIGISMSGRGRSNDNAYIERAWRTMKYEYFYLHGARTVGEYKRLLPKLLKWYNAERPHQSLGYRTPAQVLFGKHCGYVDNAIALSHRPTAPTTGKDSLISL